MTTLSQREEHKKQAVLNGYRKAVAENNVRALASLQDKYPQYASEFHDLSLTTHTFEVL